MKQPTRLLTAAVAIGVLAFAVPAAATAAPLDPTSGIVLITVSSDTSSGAGTGMVLTSSGQVLTNYHVVEGSTEVEVEIPSTGETYTATVLGHDAAKDVALLQLEGASGLSTITVDDDTLAVGDTVTAIGNANGGGELVEASGTVTALESQVTVSDGTTGSETLTGVIETNAGAVAGDSGGPMVDEEGEVVGMTTAGGQTLTRWPGQNGPDDRGGWSQGSQGGWSQGSSRGSSQGSSQGSGDTSTAQRASQMTESVTTVSYAVPIEDAMAVVEQIRSGTEAGTVEIGARAYLGVSVTATSSLVVGTVVADSPADDAGITAGSTITSLGGTAVTTHDELSDALASHSPGDSVTVTWTDSSGTSHSGTVTLGSNPVN